MNFLAHMYLSHGNKKLTVGNYVADFVRNRDMVTFSPKVIKGIYLHRYIDHFTDTHPEVLKSTRTLRKRHGKYAPVVIDVFYDYILSKHWDQFSEIPIRTFADNTYKILIDHKEIYPLHLQDLTSRMIENDFLLEYGKKSGIRKTFKRIAKRAKFHSNFATAFDDLEKDYENIANGFLKFFPEIIREVEVFIWNKA